MTIVGIVQARMGSTRLPGKVMRPIDGVPMIELLLSRLARARHLDHLMLATSEDPRDAPLAAHVAALGYDVFRGSERDVLDRYYRAAKARAAHTVVRITGDCPLIDPHLVDQVIQAYRTQGVDYLSNTQPPTYPHGLDTEVCSFAALERAARDATRPYDREHVTSYLYSSGHFTIGNLAYHEDLSGERWTVDEAEDFDVVANVFRQFRPRRDFGWLQVLALSRARPDLFAANRHLARPGGRPGPR